MRTDIPPDLFTRIDAASLDKKFDEIIELAPVGVRIRNISTRIAVKYFSSKTFQSGIRPKPKGRIRRKRKKMRKKIAVLIHDLNLQIAIFDTDMHMQPE